MRLFTAIAIAALAFAAPVAAQPFPARPVTLVVPFAPGGATDALARQFAERMGRGARQPIIVENIAGAGGTLGTGRVARAKPDGYTMLVGHVGYMPLPPAFIANSATTR